MNNMKYVQIISPYINLKKHCFNNCVYYNQKFAVLLNGTVSCLSASIIVLEVNDDLSS